MIVPLYIYRQLHPISNVLSLVKNMFQSVDIILKIIFFSLTAIIEENLFKNKIIKKKGRK